MTASLQDLAGHLAVLLPHRIVGSTLAHGELTIEVRPADIVPTLAVLRDDPVCRFGTLVDICGVDWPERAPRFDVVYHLSSLAHNRRLRVRLRTGDDIPVPSACAVYSAANWYERETWDLYGIPFADHPDLRRLLTDYGFEGHPLRKDFPLTGHVEVRYDEEKKRVVYEPVKLTQEFRGFDFRSPWEGMDRPLPGDEKAHSPTDKP